MGTGSPLKKASIHHLLNPHVLSMLTMVGCCCSWWLPRVSTPWCCRYRCRYHCPCRCRCQWRCRCCWLLPTLLNPEALSISGYVDGLSRSPELSMSVSMSVSVSVLLAPQRASQPQALAISRLRCCCCCWSLLRSTPRRCRCRCY
jgi:hypothetical protein